MDSQEVGRDWALQVMRESLRASRSLISSSADGEVITSDNEGHRPPLDPEQLRFLQELIAHLLNGRRIVTTYNIFLLVILTFLSLFYFYEKRRDRNRCRVIEGDQIGAIPAGPAGFGTDDEGTASSSSSSTLETCSEFEDALKPSNIDLERQPLLSHRQTQSKFVNKLRVSGSGSRASRLIRSWLVHQPPPIPLIGRALPSNGTTLLVLAYYGLNLFYQFWAAPLEPAHLFSLADRAGLVFAANLPLLYLLAAKNQPLKPLAGLSYEALNILHRRVGETVCLAALAHAVGILSWVFWLSPEFLRAGLVPDGSWAHFLTRPLVLHGLAALAAYETLYLTSLRGLRRRCYEAFLASHVALQAIALAFLWLHYHTARPYVGAALVIFAVDRIAWRLGLKSDWFDADLRILEDGETVMLSANWDIPLQPHRPSCWWPPCFVASWRPGTRHGWGPADHVFVSVPALGRSHRWQAHPFTIASAAPNSEHDPTAQRQHAWLSLLIRAQSGFTASLLAHAHLHGSDGSDTPVRVRVRLDGPYGSRGPLDMLRASATRVLVAGGSGIAVAFPLAWDLARAMQRRRSKRDAAEASAKAQVQVHLCWVVHSRAQRSWVPEAQLDELRSRGVHVTIPKPTAEAGRPDIPGYVRDLAFSSSVADDGGGVGVVVSGPEGMNRAVRNACADAIRNGADVRLQVEKFGW